MPHLDYSDALFDQAFKASSHEKLESIQCNACHAQTGAIKSVSKEKIYQELGLESLQLRRWYRNLCLFCKIFKNKSTAYLLNLIPARKTHHSLRNSDKIPCFNTKHIFLKKFFLPIYFNRMEQIRCRSAKMR